MQHFLRLRYNQQEEGICRKYFSLYASILSHRIFRDIATIITSFWRYSAVSPVLEEYNEATFTHTKDTKQDPCPAAFKYKHYVISSKMILTPSGNTTLGALDGKSAEESYFANPHPLSPVTTAHYSQNLCLFGANKHNFCRRLPICWNAPCLLVFSTNLIQIPVLRLAPDIFQSPDKKEIRCFCN